MSMLWQEESDIDSEAYGDVDSFEGYGEADIDSDSEDYDGESAASRRRARQRRAAALARRRRERARARQLTRRDGGRLPAPRETVEGRAGAQRETVAAIRDLDLETKVQQDAFRSTAAAQSKRMSRSEYATVAAVAVNQFIETFQAPDNAVAKAALRAAPLALLAPASKGSGFGGFVQDPRVIGAAVVAGILLVGQNRNFFSGDKAREIRVVGPTEVVVGTSDQFIADVLDGRGERLDKTVTWESSDPLVATIDAATGQVRGVTAGGVVITAKFEKIVGRARLTVRASAASPRALSDGVPGGVDRPDVVDQPSG
jgi:Bacterial Ig-like domain (group 2)